MISGQICVDNIIYFCCLQMVHFEDGKKGTEILDAENNVVESIRYEQKGAKSYFF